MHWESIIRSCSIKILLTLWVFWSVNKIRSNWTLNYLWKIRMAKKKRNKTNFSILSRLQNCSILSSKNNSKIWFWCLLMLCATLKKNWSNSMLKTKWDLCWIMKNWLLRGWFNILEDSLLMKLNSHWGEFKVHGKLRNKGQKLMKEILMENLMQVFLRMKVMNNRIVLLWMTMNSKINKEKILRTF